MDDFQSHDNRRRDENDHEGQSPVHPGQVLHEDFLEPMELSQYRLAKSIGVLPRRINEIVHGKRAVTADTALRLSRFFGTTAEFWMNLQTRYDLDITEEQIGERLDAEVDDGWIESDDPQRG